MYNHLIFKKFILKYVLSFQLIKIVYLMQFISFFVLKSIFLSKTLLSNRIIHVKVKVSENSLKALRSCNVGCIPFCKVSTSTALRDKFSL